jgi:polysaccharide export outer membrane protein
MMITNNTFWFKGHSVILDLGEIIVVPRDVVEFELLALRHGLSRIFYQSALALIAIKNVVILLNIYSSK